MYKFSTFLYFTSAIHPMFCFFQKKIYICQVLGKTERGARARSNRNSTKSVIGWLLSDWQLINAYDYCAWDFQSMPTYLIVNFIEDDLEDDFFEEEELDDEPEA